LKSFLHTCTSDKPFCLIASNISLSGATFFTPSLPGKETLPRIFFQRVVELFEDVAVKKNGLSQFGATLMLAQVSPKNFPDKLPFPPPQ
jgi:hypothetical protein